ncbi:conserved hypothetical protein [Candidatus Terasakiella magnetica]|uniref:DUF3126 domain-containing protein n=1 Tax=Candidatus Terasakiella magnetica TaxID=1867952 RepID=A0A1C3REY4_9PROT|nr:conserved hypothetical protein [Candidatus Terasakiella magnetica]
MITMDEIQKVTAHLRKTFGNDKIRIQPPKKPEHPIEVYVLDEFIGVLHRDEDEGEVSYDLNISIIEDDLIDL